MTASLKSIAFEAALQFARGHYQEAILAGTQAMSGADLQGRARSYAGHYAESRKNLLKRLNGAGCQHHVAVRAHGRLELVLGIW